MARDVKALPVVAVPKARLLSTKPGNQLSQAIVCDLLFMQLLVLREHCPVCYLTLSCHRDQSCIRSAQRSWSG